MTHHGWLEDDSYDGSAVLTSSGWWGTYDRIKGHKPVPGMMFFNFYTSECWLVLHAQRTLEDGSGGNGWYLTLLKWSWQPRLQTLRRDPHITHCWDGALWKATWWLPKDITKSGVVAE